MFVNAFMGMDFTEDERGVVLHFVNRNELAEEYLFQSGQEASKFYLMCLNFLDEVKEGDAMQQEKLFREFLDSDLIKMKFVRTVY